SRIAIEGLAPSTAELVERKNSIVPTAGASRSSRCSRYGRARSFELYRVPRRQGAVRALKGRKIRFNHMRQLQKDLVRIAELQEFDGRARGRACMVGCLGCH